MQISYYGLSFGADPEFFFKKDGEVIGAEKVLPKTGVTTMGVLSGGQTVLIIDGVQAEFNVVPNTCRQSFSTNLGLCFRRLAEQIHGKGITASFAQTVEVDKEEMESLSKEAQQFGCAPSKNAYGLTKVQVKDASKYLSRSAGGHIHMAAIDGTTRYTLRKPELVVPILDIIVGNTCVLIDRDPGNIERRKNYGRAGEYRMPKHGLEYRTPSNFWLRSYQTMSFVLGLVRFSVNIANNVEATAKLMSLVDMEDIQKAINTNDAELAQANFDKVKEFIGSITLEQSSDTDSFFFPLQGERIAQFEFFASKGLDHWFKKDIMKHWIDHNYREQVGWENFLKYKVAPEMPKLSNTVTEKTVAAIRKTYRLTSVKYF